MASVTQLKSPTGEPKDLYGMGEVPPLGHVPAKMHAWAIRKDRHGPPEHLDARSHHLLQRLPFPPQMQLAALQAGHVQQIVDHARQAQRLVAQVLRELARRRRQVRLGEEQGFGIPNPYSLMQVTSDQIRGTFTFSIDTGFRSACARNAGRSRSDLNPTWTVSGEMMRSSHAPTRFLLRKWLRMMMRPPGRHTRRISRATATGSGTTLITYGA